MIEVLIVFLAANEKKESDKKIKTRHQREIDKTVLLLETR